jgi:hypothetical protein
MKPPLLWLGLLLAVLARSALAADDLASEVIRSEPIAAYNPTNNTEEELNKAASINSGVRLQYLILHEASEEVRVCYAIRVLNSQLATAQRIAATPNDDGRAKRYLAELLDKRTKLAKQFRAIQDHKAGAANGSQPIRSETNRTSSAAGSRR